MSVLLAVACPPNKRMQLTALRAATDALTGGQQQQPLNLCVVATITQPAVIRKIREHLGVCSTPLPRAPARDVDC